MIGLFDTTNNYRAKAAKEVPFNWSRKYCHGCRKSRSVGQYTLKQDVCDQCVRRKS